MKRPMLWLDMTVSDQDPELSVEFSKHFDLHRPAERESIRAAAERSRASVAVFDFDFPTKEGLNLLRETKRSLPSLPLLMLTVQHSEQLAVWAFRTRVWDYVVKPMAHSERDRCLCSLEELLLIRDLNSGPRTVAMPGAVIPEQNRSHAGRGQETLTLAPAIAYVEQSFRDKVASSRAASLCGLSVFQFSRLFKETYGITFQEHVLRFRIREACRLLRNPNAQVTDVAALVGFNAPSYFCKIFKRYVNVSPSRFNEISGTPNDPNRILEAIDAD